MSSRPAAGLIERARASIGRGRVRRGLADVAAGARGRVAIDLGDPEVDTAALISKAAAPFGAGSVELDRLVAAMQAGGLYDTVLDQLAAHHPGRCARSARLAGALRVEPAVPAITALLPAKEPGVRDAAARALGRIGGARSAAALLDAVRHGARGATTVIELSRAAPDLFLEAALGEEAIDGSLAVVAAAAGLRRRSAAIRPLLAMLQRDDPADRAAGCRALGWLGAGGTAPAVAMRLDDPSWRVRMSAVKALRRLRAWTHSKHVAGLLADPDQRVRRAARSALRGLAA